jgi:hypothetical protein
MVTRRIVGLALAAVAATASVLVVGSASPASAAISPRNFQVVAKEVEVAPNTVARVIATCPAGTRMVNAIGMAFFSPSHLIGIAPTGSFDGAVAIGKAGPAGDTLRVDVSCSPSSNFANATKGAVDVPANGTGLTRGRASCPAGMRAFGGGGYWRTATGVSSSGKMYSNTVTFDGTGWTFSGATTNPTDRLTVITQCAPLPGSHVLTNQGPLGPDIHNPRVRVDCDAGYLPISGGAFLSTNAYAESPGVIGYSHQPRLTDPTSPYIFGWHVYGYRSSSATNWILAVAQCVPDV